MQRIRIVARFGGDGPDLSPFVLLSMALHIGFVAAIVLVPILRPRKPFPDNPLVVSLVAAARPKSVQTRAPAPPVSKPPPTQRPPKEASVEPRKPPPTKPLPEKIEPKETAEPIDPPDEQEPATTEDPAPGETAGVVGDDSGSIAALEGGDVEFAWYRASVTSALYGRWRRPVLDRLSEPVEVRVVIEIQRDGSVRGLRIEQSSGIPSVDRSALGAVADADPLPPLPANWRGPILPAAFLFRLHPE